MEKRTILENSNTRSNNLTLIKFIAAIMVIWGHAIILLQQSKDPISLLSRNELSLGSVAVAIFFFASGFYVTKSLMKKRSAREYLKNLILDRALAHYHLASILNLKIHICIFYI